MLIRTAAEQEKMRADATTGAISRLYCGTRKFHVLGYLFAMPFAFIGSLMSGLLLPPLIGTMLYGVIPLALGMIFGYALARIRGG